MLQHAIVDQLRLNAASFPDRVAIETIDGPSLTFGQAWRRVVALAETVRDEPARNGRRVVAVLLPNGPDATLAYLACQLAGCTSVPINSALAGPEMDYIVNDSRATAVLTSAPYLEVAARLEAAPRVIDCSTVPTPAQVAAIQPDVAGDAVMMIGYTSGTTGLPKGALFSNDAMYLNFVRWGWQFGLTGQQTLLTCGPMFHMSYGGLSMLAMMAGATNRIFTKFDAVAAVEELRTRATFAFLVPTMMDAILESWEQRGRPPLTSARFLLSSGAPVTAPLLTGALEAFPNATIAEAYGWSEGGWITFEVKQPETLRAQCVGWPVPGFDIAILRDDYSPCEVGEPGEIAAKNLLPFLGYLNKPDETTAAQHDGFILSGDIGVRDEDGRIRVVDRKKDMIVTGGENVYSVEVERVLLAHPEIDEAAVIGRPHPRWGEAVVAVVVPARPDSSEEEIRGFCRERLAGYKVPKAVEIVSELPRNAMGKVQKFRLRESASALAPADASMPSEPTVTESIPLREPRSVPAHRTERT